MTFFQAVVTGDVGSTVAGGTESCNEELEILWDCADRDIRYYG